MFIRLILLLLICFISYRETTTVGTTPRSVTGKKGSNSTLPCEFEASEISHIRLNRLSKKIHVCANEQCENCRVFKEGSCDIVIKDLRFSDAGKYILRFNYKNVTEKVEKMKTYQLKIHDEISVNTSEELKLDVLLTNADKVEHQSRISTEWTKVWTRVSNSNANVTDERLTVRDGNLTILHFKAIDAGTYRVLDSDGEILITVTVTEYSTDSGERKDDPEKTVESRVIAQCVIGALLALLALVAAIYAIWKSKCQNRNTGHEGYRDVPMQERVRGERGTT